MTLTDGMAAIFDEIYATELVFEPGCHRLCGDAHCCNFARHKKRFKLMARQPFQELPLLPGEYEYLSQRGLLEQFEPFRTKTIECDTGEYVFRAESIISQRAGCACNHATRTTVCRLYPVLPVLDPASGMLIGTEPLTIYDEMERIDGLAPACQIRAIPFGQLQPFLRLTGLIARTPEHRLYLEAYRITKRHVVDRLRADRLASNKSVFGIFERATLRGDLIAFDALNASLNELVRSLHICLRADAAAPPS